MTTTRHISRHRSVRPALALLCCVLAVAAPLHAQPGKENAEYKLAAGLYNDGMYDLAAEQLKTFIAAYPQTAQGIEARFTLGLTQMKLKRFDEARVTFQDFALAYVDHPKAPAAWLNVGAAFHALGNDREAASAYERVRVFHPKSDEAPAALVQAAALYRAAGDRESARKALRTVIQEYPSSASAPPARLASAELSAEEGQVDAALREARRVAESDAGPALRAAALATLGAIQESASLLAEAEASFRELATTYPSAPEAPAALLRLGTLEARTGRYAPAAEHFRTVSDNVKLGDSVRAAAATGLGTVLAAQRAQAEAHKAFTLAAALGKGTALAPEALVRASAASAGALAWDRSLAAAREAAALPPSRWTARAHLLAAQAASALRQYDDAAQSYRAALAASADGPGTDEILFRLGMLHAANRNDHRSAIASFDELARAHPQSARAADAAFATADAQLALGDADGALRTLLDIQRRFPGAARSAEIDSLLDAARKGSVARRDESLRKVTRLVGELLLDTPRAEIAYRLGVIYLDDLGDHEAAAGQFAAAIAGGLGSERRGDALFLRASALAAAGTAETRDAAVSAYDAYLKEFPSGARAEDAFYARTMLAAAALDGAARSAAYGAYLERYPSTPHAAALRLAIGRSALDAGQRPEALAAFRAAAAGGSPSVRAEALWRLGEAFTAGKQPDSALAAWSRITGAPVAGERTADALLASSTLHIARRAYDVAVRDAGRLVREFFYTPPAREGRRVLAEAQIGAGDGAAAEATLRPLVDADASSPFTVLPDAGLLLLYGKALEAKGDRPGAGRAYHRAVAAGPSPEVAAQALYALGALARTDGSAERAASYFARAATLGGTGAATAEIADLLFQSEQYKQAAAQYAALAERTDSLSLRKLYRRKAVVASLRQDDLAGAAPMAAAYASAFGKDPEALAEFAYERGLSHFRKQEYATARKAFAEVADDYRETRFGPWGEFYTAKILEVNGSLDEAAKAYSRILEKRAGSDVLPRVHLALGNMHFNAERYEDAIRHYQAITARPEEAGDVLPFAMNNLIEAYESTKLYDNALRTARDFLARYPNDENIIDKKIKIGTLYTKAGYYDQAVAHLQGILDEAGSLLEAEIRYDIGEAYYDNGEYQQAILEFLKVPYLVTRRGKVDWTATALYMAGQSYEKMSRFDDAVGMYQQIVDRPGIDATFKTAARKEIDRVRMLTNKGPK